MPNENIFLRKTVVEVPRAGAQSVPNQPALTSGLGGSTGLGGPPIAYANSISSDAAPDGRKLTDLLAPFVGKSVGSCYRGPAWLDADGVAWVVLVSKNPSWPRLARQVQQMGLITWRWNNAPAAPVSFTMALLGRCKPSGPTPRWFGCSNDPVVQSIKETGKFMVLVAEPGGPNSGWMEALYDQSESSGVGALHRQFEVMGTPGINGSHQAKRFDASGNQGDGDSRDAEIPLWVEPIGDYWATLSYNGPWSADLEHSDHLQAKWASRFLKARSTAAGSIELLRDRFVLDKEQPFFDELGVPTSRLPNTVQAKLFHAAKVSAQWARLAAAIGGPHPDAEQAYLAALDCVQDPKACEILIAIGMLTLPDVDDEHLMPSFKMFVEIALMSPDATLEGKGKPWLRNSEHGLTLKATPIDQTSQLEDVESFWQHGLDLHDLLDSGLWATGSDFPYPLANLGKEMAGTKIEGGAEAAESKVRELLLEAIEARQWSVPWGARIEISIGPFVALRIFENQGEFSCVFLDSRDRYYHVAIGLREQVPQFCSARFLLNHRVPSQPGEADVWEWEDESQLTLQLVASAVVRDFLVVEERESVFGARAFKRRIRGHDIRTVIYLPRVNYRRPTGIRAIESDESTSVSPRTRHAVSPHLRRAETASAEQRFLAQRYGVHVPKGFTFVRPHERGGLAASERLCVYRSRSASRMLFEVVEKAPEGNRPQWFEFEKDCGALLKRRGLQVRHQAVHRDGDGGVDLYATDVDGHGFVVQCKCWGLHRPVGPEVIRELFGAIALADAGASMASRGIIITTSQFTSGAREAAEQFGFELIDGPSFVRQLSEPPSP